MLSSDAAFFKVERLPSVISMATKRLMIKLLGPFVIFVAFYFLQTVGGQVLPAVPRGAGCSLEQSLRGPSPSGDMVSLSGRNFGNF
jgi:hypothetical protein